MHFLEYVSSPAAWGSKVEVEYIRIFLHILVIIGINSADMSSHEKGSQPPPPKKKICKKLLIYSTPMLGQFWASGNQTRG